ncbi:MAG: hypothetical protein EZS26_002086 [Candidatus Ordinivivax streblomastigis]|uniref:Uncharacterized protein n=1 Tax=Candidatus Ordinivivax streblomastigis TaxID=2540710 RepID=A0A5M8P021_9BACT|nr:MAG: hypothetical protein EZS26_002086 [Candidatus Ordinivivax streblomastigis]
MAYARVKGMLLRNFRPTTLTSYPFCISVVQTLCTRWSVTKSLVTETVIFISVCVSNLIGL